MKSASAFPAILVHALGAIVALLGILFAAGSTNFAGYVDGLLFVVFGVLINFWTIARTVGAHDDDLTHLAE